MYTVGVINGVKVPMEWLMVTIMYQEVTGMVTVTSQSLPTSHQSFLQCPTFSEESMETETSKTIKQDGNDLVFVV